MTISGAMANSSKKRKASVLDTSPNNHTPEGQAKKRTESKRYESKGGEDVPFTTESPYLPSSQDDDNVFVQKEEIVPGFSFDFGVRPGQMWQDMRSYRNVRLQDQTFSIGTIVYINKRSPPPKSLSPTASDAQILKYDRTNFWVGRIADTRAESDKAVFLRVYWLYWPEELPMGRQHYHSNRELIQSNAMDIIDAQTISGAADLTYLDEKNLDVQPRDRFWRQTFDISQLGEDRQGGLSELRKHCVCRQYYNPDKVMFQCKNESCQTWNHKECLVHRVLQDVWPIFESEGTLDSLGKSNIKIGARGGGNVLPTWLLKPVRQLGKLVQNRMTPSLDTLIDQALPHKDNAHVSLEGTETKTTQPKKSGIAKPSKRPMWEGKLKGQLETADESEEGASIYVRIDKVVGKQSKSTTERWFAPVHCLICNETMN